MANQYQPNYNHRTSKRISPIRKKKMILSWLLSMTIGITSVYGIVEGVKNISEKITDDFNYSRDSKVYEEMVNNNFHRTIDKEAYFLRTYELSRDFKELKFESKEEVYHALLGCARFMRYNIDENFRDFIRVLDLDSLAQSNPVYPTSQELYSFIESLDCIKEDGTIDFEKWKEYDKKVFNLERELEELKEGKNLW